MGQRQLAASFTGGLPRFFHNDPFPPMLHRSLSYSNVVAPGSTTSANTVGGTYSYRLNSLYDPYVGAGGSQPYGFDQLCSSAGPYLRYKVVGCRIKVTFSAPSAASGQMGCIQIRNPSDSAVPLTGLTYDKLAEKHNTVAVFVPDTGSQSKTLSFSFPNLASMFGWTKGMFDNDVDTTTGGYNSNPGSMPVMEVGVLDTKSSGTSITLQAHIQITYDAVFYQRSTLVQS